ncbi:hypothetical protein HGRIS_014327 [Hohenbuehelia grisea]|uniref:Uncharacterized protein n=1 Tax=Hohenbuehelia grisea TaxID=104357 RepID=A0ABR3JT14_9AGAR
MVRFCIAYSRPAAYRCTIRFSQGSAPQVTTASIMFGRKPQRIAFEFRPSDILLTGNLPTRKRHLPGKEVFELSDAFHHVETDLEGKALSVNHPSHQPLDTFQAVPFIGGIGSEFHAPHGGSPNPAASS